MKSTIRLAVLVASSQLTVFCPILGAAPPNDNFADALPIDPLPYSITGNLQGATREPNEPLGPYSDVGTESLWWSFAPTELGVLTVSAQADLWQPRWVAYRGSVLTNLESLATAATVRVRTDPGQVYQFQLAAVLGSGSEFALAASFTPAPTNDLFAQRIHLDGTNHTISAWFLDASVEPGEPLADPAITRTLWWSWTAPADGRVVVTPASTMVPPTGKASVAFYTGPAVDQLTPLSVRAPNTYAYGPWTFAATAGTVYHLQLWPQGDGPEPTGFDLAFTTFGPARNDNFTQATVLDYDHPSTIESNVGATREPGEPSQRPGGPNKSIWWRWTAAYNSTGAAAQVGLGTLTNVTLAVYQGASISTLRLVGSGTDIARFDALATETYYIAAETAANVDGDIELSCSGGALNGGHREIPGNLVKNPSFEVFITSDWMGGNGGRPLTVAPDGQSYAWTGGEALSQDIPTTPGQSYRLRFVYANEDHMDDATLLLKFGDTQIALLDVPRFQWWRPAEFILTAAVPVSRLEFLGDGGLVDLDQVSLLWLNDPPSIVTPPVAATVYSGRPALFQATISGTEPLSLQWYFNEAPLAGATEALLIIPSVTPADAGSYFIVATNAFGAVTSAPVSLTVEAPVSPQFVLQPQSDHVYAGQYVGLQVAAVGTPPLNYQWFHDGVAVPGATSASLVLPNFSTNDAGTYLVKVSNETESATSLAATLTLADAAPARGGLVRFANVSEAPGSLTIFAPVFDVDGLTRLNGPDFVSQMYAGVTPEQLRPVAPPREFSSGFWQPMTVVLPNGAPNATVFVQARVWDRRSGVTYETARALGGKFGRSALLQIVAGEPHMPPFPFEGAPLTGLVSFQLQAGLPNFTTGLLELTEHRDDGTLLWQLKGAAGFRYLVERQTDGANWTPFQVLTNATGIVTFTDTSAGDAKMQLYRARMLD